MGQLAYLLRRGRELIDTHQLVDRLGGGEMVAYRADAAEALHQHRQLPVGAPLDKLLEATELDDVESRLLYDVVFIQQQ